MTIRMTDKTVFAPFKPESRMAVVITKREAVLIDKLRKHAYGKFTVHKINSVIIRLEINDSQLIEEDQEVDLS